MQREYVDFFLVPDHQIKIHRRLENWARWQYNRPCWFVQPMFRLYRSPEQWDGAVVSNPVDAMDAQEIQKHVRQLPEKNRLAISWCYIKRTNPRKAAQTIGETLTGLGQLVKDGRTMLINRLTVSRQA